MTTIISRLYNDPAAAEAVVSALRAKGYPAHTVDLIAGSAGAAAIRAAGVGAASAAAYAERIATGKALVVVRAAFNPIGAARDAMRIVDSFDPLHVAGAVPDDYVVEPLRDDLYQLSILHDHPRFLSPDATALSGRPHPLASEVFGLRLLSPHKTRMSAIKGGRFMSGWFFPLPLLSRKRSGTRVIPGGGTPFSTRFGLRLLSPRR